jgi:two-component system sensor histidine kinase KdpD
MKSESERLTMTIQKIFTKGNMLRTLLLCLIFLTATGIGFLFRYINFPDTNIVVIYLLAVLVMAWLGQSFIFGFIASLLATFLFNYFFTDPAFTFTVDDLKHIITFITMTVCALIISTLTSHSNKSARMALEKEAETTAIFNLTNHLTDAKELHDISATAVTAMSDFFSCNVGCLCFDENNMPEPIFIQQSSDKKLIQRKVDNPQELKYVIEAIRVGCHAGDEFYDWPIYGAAQILGAIRIPKEYGEIMKDSQMRLFHSMIESIALAMDRFRLEEQRLKSREEILKERYRGNLLHAISHDIRTPLFGILNNSERLINLVQPDNSLYELSLNIRKDADWLEALVENTLNLTQLREGKLHLHKQKEIAGDIIAEVVTHISKHAPDHIITIQIPTDFPKILMDAKLIRQVVINLLDNAIKYSRIDQEIRVEAEINNDTDMAVFTIKDQGSGIRKKDLPNIFKLFYTAHPRQADARHGTGLGLAISKSIVTAHGGDIIAKNGDDGIGAAFVFTLPLNI